MGGSDWMGNVEIRAEKRRKNDFTKMLLGGYAPMCGFYFIDDKPSFFRY